MNLPTNASESFRRRNPTLYSVKPSISHTEQLERPKELARSGPGKAQGAGLPINNDVKEWQLVSMSISKQVCASYVKTKSIYKTAKQFSVCGETVRKILNLAGVSTSNRNWNPEEAVERYGRIAPQIERGRWQSEWISCGGKRLYARSLWEANYARYLEWQKVQGLISDWEHEPKTFWFENIRRGVRSYLPDFKVTMKNGSHEWHEVKGWMDARSKTKIKRMAKYYPAEVLRVLDGNWFRDANRKLSGIVHDWATKRVKSSSKSSKSK